MKRKTSILLLILMTLLLLAVPVEAVLVPYHAPTLTLLSSNAPRDLEMEIHIHRVKSQVTVPMQKKTVAWEQQYRLFREAVFTISAWYGNNVDLRDAELIMTTGGETKTVVLPRDVTDRMTGNDVLVYNYKKGTFHLGDPFWRGPLMLIMRILVAVAIEVLFFRLRSFFRGRSLAVAALSTAVTYTPLNLWTYNWLNMDNRAIVPYIVFFFMVMVAQIVINVLFIDEDTRDKVTGVTIQATFCAIVSNVLMLTLLPV